MASPGGPAAGATDLGAPELLTVLTTEHFALQGTRGITTAEATSRASLYVATLSSGLVAIGFASNHSFLGYFLASVLPLVAVVGVVTFVRLVALSADDLRLMRDIERIHSHYAALSPTAALYFPYVDTSDLNALLALPLNEQGAAASRGFRVLQALVRLARRRRRSRDSRVATAHLCQDMKALMSLAASSGYWNSEACAASG
jgi:hypothetical protein